MKSNLKINFDWKTLFLEYKESLFESMNIMRMDNMRYAMVAMRTEEMQEG